MEKQIELLVNYILEKSILLKQILVKYENENVADDEIKLSLSAIKTVKYL